MAKPDDILGPALKENVMTKPSKTGATHEGQREDDLQRDGGGRGHASERSKKNIDKELDQALADSFPASDPPATSQPTSVEPAGDPKVKP